MRDGDGLGPPAGHPRPPDGRRVVERRNDAHGGHRPQVFGRVQVVSLGTREQVGSGDTLFPLVVRNGVGNNSLLHQALFLNAGSDRYGQTLGKYWQYIYKYLVAASGSKTIKTI